MSDISINFSVVLKDSDPATPEGREVLERNLTEFLELSPARVNELMNSLPVTLKSECSEEEAKAFAKILREQGALVFVEKTMVSDEMLASKALSSTNLKTIHQHPYFIPVLGALVALLGISFLLRPSTPTGIIIDSNSLASMLQSQRTITGDGAVAKKAKKKAEELVLAGKSYVRPVAITAEAIEKNGKVNQAGIKFATESPGDLTPEEIIRGIQLTWLEKGEIYFTKKESEDDDDDEEEKKKKVVLKGDAKLYITRGTLNERIVAEAELEQLPSVNKLERKFMFKLRYRPKDQFIDDPFFVEYKEDSGYSIALNQEITLSKKVEDKESALNKLDENRKKRADKAKAKATEAKTENE